MGIDTQDHIMLKYRCLVVAIIILCFNQIAQAMVYDNRFIPLFKSPRVIMPNKHSCFTPELFFATASRSFKDSDSDEEIGLSELYGLYDQGQLARAMESVGLPNLLLPEWRRYELRWHMRGKLQAQSFVFSLEKSILSYCKKFHYFAGINSLIMQTHGRTEFIFDNQSPNKVFGDGNNQELDQIRRQMNDLLNLNAGAFRQIGFGDFDIYFGARKQWDHLYKFRTVYLDGRLGMLAPTGVNQDWNTVGSIPFGGNGHWGIYGANKVKVEVKENLKVGYLFRINKRFARNVKMRLSVKGEPILFGVEYGKVRVDPAPTIIFAPYFAAENIRDGFGVHIVYTLRYHGQDSWVDLRQGFGLVELDLKQAIKNTAWSSDYFTLKAFYDFGKTKMERSLEPVLYAAWDIPSAMLATKRVYKTNRFTVGIQFSF